MRRQWNWPTAISGWCYWASLAAIATVALLLSATIPLAPALGDGGTDVLIKVMITGIAGAGGVFLLGLVCNMTGH